MFTGIITGVGTVKGVTPIGAGRDMRLTVTTPWQDTATIPIGASIACSGCCLTAVAVGADWFATDVSAETLARTTLGEWQGGTRINLERSLRLGEELGGHLVFGHVDGIGHALQARPEQGSVRWRFAIPPALSRFIAVKGSIAVDGVSLTINDVGAEEIAVNIIPHTAEVTRFGWLQAGESVNLEIDMLARYAQRFAETR
ncbi:MAG: riboflavin synthase [Acetobacteraceae bacterium]